MRVNDHPVSPSTGAVNTISAYPIISQGFSGNYRLKFDMWINYNGAAGGGPRSTEWMLAGINQGTRGNRVAGLYFDAQHTARNGRADDIDVMHARATFVDDFDANVAAVCLGKVRRDRVRQQGQRDRDDDHGSRNDPEHPHPARAPLKLIIRHSYSLDLSTPTRSSRSTPRRTDSAAPTTAAATNSAERP
jgi:hypothetical protein